jgi:hypothetical protein
MTSMTLLSLLGFHIHAPYCLLARRMWSFILTTHNRKVNDTWGTYVFLSHLKPFDLGKGYIRESGFGQFNIDYFKQQN